MSRYNNNTSEYFQIIAAGIYAELYSRDISTNEEKKLTANSIWLAIVQLLRLHIVQRLAIL